MPLVLPAPTARNVDVVRFTEQRRAACTDGAPLLPRLTELGVRLCTDLTRVGTGVGAVLRLEDGWWVIGLSSDLEEDTCERVLSSLFLREFGIDTERPLVIMQRDSGLWNPFLTWCPQGCDTDHTDDVQRGTALADLRHDIGPSVSTALPIWDARQGTAEVHFLSGQICVDPYSQDARRTVPHVNLEVSMDDWMECLGPDELSGVIAALRAHLDEMEELRDRLVKARAQYRGPNS
ncbi:DUF6907 domain-containing protein [Streptomyces sp. NPDC058398]|uniref:DUF6907 domain-containing protein n=1 Tax=Streptomyces sp. NPDC058398 TaxID=3346479 RepID=UPI00364753B7